MKSIIVLFFNKLIALFCAIQDPLSCWYRKHIVLRFQLVIKGFQEIKGNFNSLCNKKKKTFNPPKIILSPQTVLPPVPEENDPGYENPVGRILSELFAFIIAGLIGYILTKNTSDVSFFNTLKGYNLLNFLVLILTVTLLWFIYDAERMGLRNNAGRLIFFLLLFTCNTYINEYLEIIKNTESWQEIIVWSSALASFVYFFNAREKFRILGRARFLSIALTTILFAWGYFSYLYADHKVNEPNLPLGRDSLGREYTINKNSFKKSTDPLLVLITKFIALKEKSLFSGDYSETDISRIFYSNMLIENKKLESVFNIRCDDKALSKNDFQDIINKDTLVKYKNYPDVFITGEMLESNSSDMIYTHVIIKKTSMNEIVKSIDSSIKSYKDGFYSFFLGNNNRTKLVEIEDITNTIFSQVLADTKQSSTSNSFTFISRLNIAPLIALRYLEILNLYDNLSRSDTVSQLELIRNSIEYILANLYDDDAVKGTSENYSALQYFILLDIYFCKEYQKRYVGNSKDHEINYRLINHLNELMHLNKQTYIYPKYVKDLILAYFHFQNFENKSSKYMSKILSSVYADSVKNQFSIDKQSFNTFKTIYESSVK